MSEFEEAVLNLLNDMEEEKKRRGIAPTHTISAELHLMLKSALNNLYRSGKINVGITLNGKYIEVKREDGNK